MRFLIFLISLFVTQICLAIDNSKIAIFGTVIEFTKSFVIKGPYRNGTVTFTTEPSDNDNVLSLFYVQERKSDDEYCNSNAPIVKNIEIRYGIINEENLTDETRMLIVCDSTNILFVGFNDVFAKQVIEKLELKIEADPK